MKTIKLLSLLGIIAYSLASCGKDNVQNIQIVKQRIYFQYEYINYAWGFQHTGWMIDSSGNVYCFNKPANWYYTDSLGLITSTRMDSNLIETNSVCYKIDKDVLKEKIGLLYVAAKGKISEPSRAGYDGGNLDYLGFTYSKEDKIYKRVVLKQTGDVLIKNSSPAATQLAEWLDSLNYSIYRGKK